MKDLSKDWTGRCHRCGKKVSSHTMSKFNTDLICLTCSNKEKHHPDYDRAVETELAAIRQGNYNFPGIGWTKMPGLIGPDDRPANILGG